VTKDLVLGFIGLLSLAVLPGSALGDPGQPESPGDDVSITAPSLEAAEKVTLGEVEDVMLEPWTITLPARIDTGATLSSLDAQDLSIRGEIADFVLGKQYGGLRLRLPIVDWVYVRSAGGVAKRPVAEIHICLGSRRIRTVATLRDRSQMTYPFLVGRNVLNGSFVVDTSRSRTVRPRCQAASFPLTSSDNDR
jgi:hypothetical protein